MGDRISGLCCCIKTCNRSRRKDRMKMFVFPRADTLIGRIWREKCNIPKTIYHMRPRICDRHFDKNDIGVKFLKRTAVPRYFLNQISEENGNDDCQSNGDESTYDWRSLDTEASTSCLNCDSNIEWAQFYEKRYDNLSIENDNLKRQVETLSEKRELFDHMEPVTYYEMKCEELSGKCSEYKKLAEDSMDTSLRNIERAKYYERKCEALNAKYTKIINQLQNQLENQSENTNCIKEPMLPGNIPNSEPSPNVIPETPQQEIVNSPKTLPINIKEDVVLETSLNETIAIKDDDEIISNETIAIKDNEGDEMYLGKNEIIENVVLETPQQETVIANEAMLIAHNEDAASETSSNVTIAIEDDNEMIGLKDDNEAVAFEDDDEAAAPGDDDEAVAIKDIEDYDVDARCLAEEENEGETEEIDESDSEINFNFIDENSLMSPSSIKQEEEEFIIE